MICWGLDAAGVRTRARRLRPRAQTSRERQCMQLAAHATAHQNSQTQTHRPPNSTLDLDSYGTERRHRLLLICGEFGKRYDPETPQSPPERYPGRHHSNRTRSRIRSGHFVARDFGAILQTNDARNYSRQSRKQRRVGFILIASSTSKFHTRGSRPAALAPRQRPAARLCRAEAMMRPFPSSHLSCR